MKYHPIAQSGTFKTGQTNALVRGVLEGVDHMVDAMPVILQRLSDC